MGRVNAKKWKAKAQVAFAATEKAWSEPAKITLKILPKVFKPLVEEGELDLGMDLSGNRGLLDLNRTDGESKEDILEEGSRKQGQKNVRQIRQRPEAKGEIEEESEEDEKREDEKLEGNEILVTLLPSPFKTTNQAKTKKRLSNTTFLLQSTKPLNTKKRYFCRQFCYT